MKSTELFAGVGAGEGEGSVCASHSCVYKLLLFVLGTRKSAPLNPPATGEGGMCLTVAGL